MTYEDAIRVADLKIRRTRFDRVRQEARADSNQIVEIHEYLHPGIEEITDMLPSGLGRWVLTTGWAKRLLERFTRKGRIVTTTSLTGFLQLYGLAALRIWRRRSLRFQREREVMDQWLAQLLEIGRSDYALAAELAQCPRLLKGYGETHRLGTRNFEAIMSSVPHLRGKSDAAGCVKKLREAALADDSGAKLTEALREVGA